MKITILLTLFFFFHINATQSQNWEWNIQPGSDGISELNYIYPITKDRWLMQGTFKNNFVPFNQTLYYFSMVDSTGTVWGSNDLYDRIIDIKRVNENLLYIGFGDSPTGPMYRIKQYAIESNKLVLLDDDVSSNFFVDAYSLGPDQSIAAAQNFQNAIAGIQIIGTNQYYQFSNSRINNIINLGNNNYIVVGDLQEQGNQFGLMKLKGEATNNSDIEVLTTSFPNKKLDHIFALPNGNFIAKDSTHIHLLNDSFSILKSMSFNPSGKFINLIIEENSIYLATSPFDNQIQINEFDFNLDLLDERILEVPSTHIKSFQVKENTFGIGGTVHPITPNNTHTYASSMLLKVMPKGQPMKFEGIDIGIEKVRIPAFSIKENIDCAEPLLNIFVDRVKITVKNKGPQTINELYVNFNFDGTNICNGSVLPPRLSTTVFSEKIFNLDLKPNETTVLTVKDLRLFSVHPDQLEHLKLLPICFWISSINRSLDVDPADNYQCERILIHNEKIPELSDPENNFVLFPNPVKNRLQVRLLSPNLFFKRVWISNVWGETLLSKINFEDRYLMDFEVEHFPSGIYFINFEDERNLYSEKFIKQ